jgi:hypothetical protein
MPIQSETIIAILLMIGAAFLLWVARDYPQVWEGIPGPAFMPRLTLYMLIFLCLLLLVQVARGKYKEKHTFGRIGLVGISAALSFLYLYATPRFHYFYVTPIFLMVMMRLLDTRSWKRIIIVSAVFTAFVYLFFYKQLGVPLP